MERIKRSVVVAHKKLSISAIVSSLLLTVFLRGSVSADFYMAFLRIAIAVMVLLFVRGVWLHDMIRRHGVDED